ncbi:MAG: hypothetical protein WD851_04070 [Pirellulales bacterium]
MDTTKALDAAEFREYFDEIPEDEYASEIQKRCDKTGFTSLPFDPDYVEDETGTPTTHAAIIESVHGVKNPIIFGDRHSVLVRELRAASHVDNWSVEKANICAQFLEVVEHIARSAWFRTPPKCTYIGTKSNSSALVEMEVPNVEKTMAILAFVRQIFAEHRQDGLFEAMCVIFAEHCGDSGKALWMSECLSAFTRDLESESGFFGLGGRKCREILNMFLYGAGLMHAKPHSHFREDGNLAEAIDEHGRERVVAAFHFALHSVMRVPFNAYPVIRQEFLHWTRTCGMAAPNRVELVELFRNVGSHHDTAERHNEHQP